MIRLVVNADDLGLHPGIDSGILRAHAEGIVTSATVLVRGATAAEAIGRARAAGLGLGVHLTLTHLPPAADAAQVPSLLRGGRLRRDWADVAAALGSARMRLDEIERELRAQIDLAVALGAEPDHLDGHQHVHLLPGVAGVVARLARERGLPVRRPADGPSAAWWSRPGAALKSALLGALGAATSTEGVRTVRSLGAFEAGVLDEPALLGLLDGLGDGDHEISCHPGEGVDGVPEDPAWRYGWDEELRALTSPRVRELVAARAIRLTTWAGLT